MKQRAKALVMAVIMFFLTVAGSVSDSMTVQAAEDLVIKLHYNREDGNYDGWKVWFWEVGAEGADFEFAEEDGDMVATKVVTPGVTSVGFIVKTADWAKDVDMDQFIDVAEMISGTVHIYVESGVEGYTKEYGDDAVTGIKVNKARYDNENQAVIVTMTASIGEDADGAFSVAGESGEVSITSVTEGDSFEYTLAVSEELDLLKSYSLSYDGNEYEIVMPIIYSTEGFEADYTYTGNDLGATWSSEKTSFRVWAPTAEAVKVNLYESGTEGTDDLIEQLEMTADVNGTWVAEKAGDLNGTYYTYSVTIAGEESEACDPYARTTGVNGKRAMVIDLDSTDPEGWEKDTDPNAGIAFTDAVIYELHVRDLSVDESSGITNKGKFLGLTETGTTTESGIPTGLDYMKDLGITHLHLLPSYDYGSVDETKLDTPQFNWGYDPVNYNVPEGSYSTDPYNGEVRVKEMKEMVQTLHENNISVVMDVVYNHVYSAEEFCFNKIVPGYFSRISENGIYSNGSGCGNDTASERTMVRKYIVDSVKYWVEEYHIDGFRFDLVGLIDTQTINEVIAEVHKDHPNVVFYGEGWTMTTNLTKSGYTMTTQVNSTETPEFAFFNDTLRDALKGSVFSSTEKGYVSGALGKESTIEQCFMGQASWCKSPSQTINYTSCHDNLTLFDRIVSATPDASVEDQIRMNNLAAAISLTSEGIPFIHAGEEILRTKVNEDGTFNENSYSSSDEVNNIKWDTLNDETYQNVYNYYKGLIAFRKAHPSLRLTTEEEVNANVVPVEGLERNVVAFEITEEGSGNLFVVFNANKEAQEITLPEGKWSVCVNAEKAGVEALETITAGTVTVEPISAMILVEGDVPTAGTGDAAGNGNAAPIIIVVLLALAAGVGFYVKKKKKH